MEHQVDPKRVGERLRAWRSERNWSGPEAAAMVQDKAARDFTWATLRAAEQGDTAPEDWALEVLAVVYERPLADLVGAATVDELAADQVPVETDGIDERSDELKKLSPYRPSALPSSTTFSAWELPPGSRIRRSDLHDRFGGSRTGAIAPCEETANVLLFTDPTAVPEHGHLNRWSDDGKVFLFVAQGDKGDQQLVLGNAAVLHHRKDGRKALRLFEGLDGVVTYAGEFEVAAPKAYLIEAAPETDEGPGRRVIVFRLVPIG